MASSTNAMIASAKRGTSSVSGNGMVRPVLSEKGMRSGGSMSWPGRRRRARVNEARHHAVRPGSGGPGRVLVRGAGWRGVADAGQVSPAVAAPQLPFTDPWGAVEVVGEVPGEVLEAGPVAGCRCGAEDAGAAFVIHEPDHRHTVGLRLGEWQLWRGHSW